MKRKKLKGFTLIELIIVMAIFVSVLTAILQLMEPINEVYADTVMYESQRTAEQGIADYITESLRYSERASIIDHGETVTYADGSTTRTITSEEDAVKYFANKNDLDLSDSDDAARINVIRIDRTTTYTDKGYTYTGRLIRRKGWNSSVTPLTGTVDISTVKSTYKTSDLYMALGPDYYGKDSYSIYLPNNYTADYEHFDDAGNSLGTYPDPINQQQRGFDVVCESFNLDGTMANTLRSNRRISSVTSSSVTAMNYLIKIDMLDYQTNAQVDFGRYNTATGYGGSRPSDTYIVFIRPEVDNPNG